LILFSDKPFSTHISLELLDDAASSSMILGRQRADEECHDAISYAWMSLAGLATP
jgi:hypothetical protein